MYNYCAHCGRKFGEPGNKRICNRCAYIGNGRRVHRVPHDHHHHHHNDSWGCLGWVLFFITLGMWEP